MDEPFFGRASVTYTCPRCKAEVDFSVRFDPLTHKTHMVTVCSNGHEISQEGAPGQAFPLMPGREMFVQPITPETPTRRKA